jgi:hypothetical protein
MCLACAPTKQTVHWVQALLLGTLAEPLLRSGDIIFRSNAIVCAWCIVTPHWKPGCRPLAS